MPPYLTRNTDHSALLLALVVVLGSLLTSLSAPLALSALLAAGQLTMGVGKGSLITAQKVRKGSVWL